MSDAHARLVSDLTSDLAFVSRVGRDGSTEVEWLSASWTRTTGYTVEELLKADDWKLHVHPEDHAAASAALVSLLEEIDPCEDR